MAKPQLQGERLTDERIRRYAPADRASVRRLALECADPRAVPGCLGDRPDAAADGMTRYYTDFEPASCFVAEDATGAVVGYALGCLSTPRRDPVVVARVLPGLILRAVVSGAAFRCPIGSILRSVLRSRRASHAAKRAVRRDCPAHVHLAVREDVRRRGLGRALLARFAEHAFRGGVSGIHAAVVASNVAARTTFERVGFRECVRYVVEFPGAAEAVPMVLFEKRAPAERPLQAEGIAS